MSSGFTESNPKAYERELFKAMFHSSPVTRMTISAMPAAVIYLVWLYIRCLQSVLPIRSRQSCILGHSPPECLQTADLCVCNSFARCTPFLQPPARSMKDNRRILK